MLGGMKTQKAETKKQLRIKAPPFGTTQPRFQTIGLPVQESCTSRYTNLGPATYDLSKALKRQEKSVLDWTLESNKQKGKPQRKKKQILGPATHNLPDFIEDLFNKSHNEKPDVGFGTSPRKDETEKKFAVPGPNLYDTRLASSKSERWRSLKPTFDRDNHINRFKTRMFLTPWSLPCNRYGFYKDINTPRVADIVERKVSLRGPYDISTGPRFPTFKDETVNWPGKLPDFFEEFKKPNRANYGKWWPKEKESRYSGSRLECMQVKSGPDVPGPGHYNPTPSSTDEDLKTTVAFMSSVKECRPSVHPKVFPGPGRYNLQRKSKNTIRHSYKSVFKSKTKRDSFFKKEEYLAW